MAELLQWRCDRPPTPQPLAAPRVWATRRRLRCVRAACGGWGVQRQRWAARHVRSKSEEAGAGGLFSSAPMRESRAPRRLPPRPHSNSRVQARMRFGRWSVRFLGDAARGRAQPGPRRGLLGCIDGVLGLDAPPTAPLSTPFWQCPQLLRRSRRERANRADRAESSIRSHTKDAVQGAIRSPCGALGGNVAAF